MPSKAGRGKAEIHAEGQSKGAKAGTDAAAEFLGKAAAKQDATVWPVGRISRRAAARVRAGHPWIYQSDVEEMIAETGQGMVAPGSLLRVTDDRGATLGTAIYSDASLI
ncbi:MAG: hypothetical protein WBF45_02600, partial [Acidobacteriaceae bacterium]